MSQTPVALSFSCLDPSGALGISADIQTFLSFNVYPVTVATTVAVADTRDIFQMEALEGESILMQARHLFEDFVVCAIKIGHIGQVENVSVLAEIVADYPDIPLILDLDTHVVSQDVSDELAQAIREELLPFSHLLVSNPLEARWLLGANEFEGEEGSAPEDLAAQLYLAGAPKLLLTGILAEHGELYNYFFDGNECLRRDAWNWIDREVRGAGDTLSAAIVALVALGLPLSEAAIEAQSFVWQSVAQSTRPAMGLYVPDRFFWLHEEQDTPRNMS